MVSFLLSIFATLCSYFKALSERLVVLSITAPTSSRNMKTDQSTGTWGREPQPLPPVPALSPLPLDTPTHLAKGRHISNGALSRGRHSDPSQPVSQSTLSQTFCSMGYPLYPKPLSLEELYNEYCATRSHYIPNSTYLFADDAVDEVDLGKLFKLAFDYSAGWV